MALDQRSRWWAASTGGVLFAGTVPVTVQETGPAGDMNLTRRQCGVRV
jgi:hypothetical protein